MANANRTRPIQIIVRVSEYEREIIRKRMELANTKNLSYFLRKTATDGVILNMDYSNIKNICAELGRIGTNINQIAKRVNSTSNIYDADIAEIKRNQKEIWALINAMGEKIL